MKRAPNIVEFVTDPQLLNLKISEPQQVLLKSIYGLPLDDAERDIFHLCTGRTEYALGRGYDETTALCGARGGKDSRIACPVVLYEAVYGGHERHLSKGERGVVPLVAQDTRATAIARNYLADYITGSSLLSSMLDGDPVAQEIRLTNKMSIMCFPSTKSSLRGWSIPAAVLDELAFWRLEGAADSDTEIQTSIRRGMIGFPRTKLIKISTPYLRSGVLFDDFKNYFGVHSPDLLLWRATSRFMNPTLRSDRLDRERRLDPERFLREYEAEFLENLESFLAQAWIDRAVMPGRFEVPPNPDRSYVVAIDPSGGGEDQFTMSIVHLEDNDPPTVVQDVCKGWKKVRGQTVDLDGIVRQICETMSPYGQKTCFGDKYSAGWVIEGFARLGVTYLHPELDTSQCYLALEPHFVQGRIQILDHGQLQKELRLLEKHNRPGGRALVDHPKGGHDDHSTSLALAVAMATQGIDFMPESGGERVFTRDSWEQEYTGHPVDALLDRARGRQFWT